MMLIFVIIFVLIVLWLIYRNKIMNILKCNNIPGPRANLITGNMLEYNSTPNVIWDSKMIDQYGPICGYYVGAKPVVVIADPNLIKKIEETYGTNFLARPRRVPGGINPDPRRAKMLANLPVPEWNELRKILSKSFTPCRLMSMSSCINSLIEELMDQIFLKSKDSRELNIYPLFQDLTLKLISQTGFSVDDNFHGDILKAAIDEEFSKRATSKLTQFCLCFPELRMIVQRLRIIFEGKSKGSLLFDVCANLLANRQNEEQTDILQVMLNSNIKADRLKVVANSVLFFETAYETLSAGLAFIINLLINNPLVQKKARQEILTIVGENELENGQLSEESMRKLKYLDAVIKEGLRMYPPQTTFISRAGDKDFVYKINEEIVCTIPKGVQVQIALFQIQNSSEFWDEPEVFKPERHLENNNNPIYSSVFQPFGKGRRQCIGQRYARLILQMTLVKILSKYSISPSLNTESRVTVTYKTATMTPTHGCFGQFDPIY